MIIWDNPPIARTDVSLEGVTEWTHGWDEDLELTILREQNQKLLKVVQYYANKENWVSSYNDEQIGLDEYFDLLDGSIDIDDDKYAGKQARQVLEELGISIFEGNE